MAFNESSTENIIFKCILQTENSKIYRRKSSSYERNYSWNESYKNVLLGKTLRGSCSKNTKVRIFPCPLGITYVYYNVCKNVNLIKTFETKNTSARSTIIFIAFLDR